MRGAPSNSFNSVRTKMGLSRVAAPLGFFGNSSPYALTLTPYVVKILSPLYNPKVSFRVVKSLSKCKNGG